MFRSLATTSTEFTGPIEYRGCGITVQLFETAVHEGAEEAGSEEESHSEAAPVKAKKKSRR